MTDDLPLFTQPPYTPRDLGEAGQADAERHTTDHMPGWLLQRLGDALLAQYGEFTSDAVRREAGETVNAWLTAEPERVNCFSGWWQRAVRRHHLHRVGSVPSSRDDRRGAYVSLWRFP